MKPHGRPLYQPPNAGSGWPGVGPNDHVRMLRELLLPCGPELAHRWLAALLRVPAEDRGAIVAEMERRVAERPGAAPPPRGPDSLTVVHPPVDMGGYVEQLERTYVVHKPTRTGGAARARRSRGG